MKNILLSTITNTSRLLTYLVVFFFLARILSVEDFGIFTYAQTFAIILVLFSDSGYTLKVAKESAESRHNISNIIGESLFIRSILALIIVLFCFILIIMDKNGDLYSILIFIFTLSSLFQSFATNLFIVYRSTDNFKIESKLVTLYNVLITVIGVAVAYFTENIYYVSLVYLLFRGLLFFNILIIYNRDFRIRWIPTSLVKTLKSLSPYAIHYILSGLYLSINILIIKFYISEFDLGIYQAGMKILTGATFMLFVVHQVYIPKFSIIKNRNYYKQYVSQINTACILIGIIVSVLIIIFREAIILIMFGEKYLVLQEYIFWFGILIFLRFFGVIFEVLLTVSDRQKYRTKYLVISVVILLILNPILMPRFEIAGSLIALVISHSILYILNLIKIRKEFNSFFILKISDFRIKKLDLKYNE